MKLRPGSMKAIYKDDPFPHVLLEDFYTKGEWETAMREILKLDPHLLPPGMTGSARHPETGQPMKFNNGLFLNDAMPNSEIVSLARRHIFDELVNQIDVLWWTELWRRNNRQGWLISRYSNGQYYNAHADLSQFTFLLWLHHHPKPFTGGDLIFPDYDNYTIPCKDNTGIIFFGPTRHEVPPIQGNGRYTITLFTGLHGKV